MVSSKRFSDIFVPDYKRGTISLCSRGRPWVMRGGGGGGGGGNRLYRDNI